MTEAVARPPLLRHKSSWERIDKSRVSDITLAKVNRNRTIQIEVMFLTLAPIYYFHRIPN